MPNANFVYRNTVYANIITQLVSLRNKRDFSKFVQCPKESCYIKLYTPYSLYKHIEQTHPEDKLHANTYFKYIFELIIIVSNLTIFIFRQRATSTVSANQESNGNNQDDNANQVEIEISVEDNFEYVDVPRSMLNDDFLFDDYLKACLIVCV